MELKLGKVIHTPSKTEDVEDPLGINSNESAIVEEQKSYQKLIDEKLKSAADWDIRDSRMFCLR